MQGILKSLMYNVYYPAVLGTVLVMLLSYPFEVTGAVHRTEPFLLLALFVYMSAAFIVAQSTSQYGWDLFMIDLAELVVVVTAVFFLGFLGRSASSDGLRSAYLTCSALPLLAAIWNWRCGYLDWKYLLLSTVGCAVLVVGYFLGFRSINFNWTMVAAVFLALGTYLIVLSRD